MARDPILSTRHPRTGPAPTLKITKTAKEATDAIGGINRGDALQLVGMDSWTIEGILMRLLDRMGSAHMTIAVWTFEGSAGQRLLVPIGDGRILSFRAIIDLAYRVSADPMVRRIQAAMPSADVRIARTHAKLYLLGNDEWSFVVEASANLASYRTLESCQITEGRALLDFHLAWYADAIEQAQPFQALF